MITAWMSGFVTGAGLIIAIGAQNAFVLVQSLKRQHHLTVAAICAAIDALLISAGVLGMGAFIQGNRVLQLVATLGGAAFLLFFGAMSLKASFADNTLDTSKDDDAQSLKKIVLSTLALSLLNPHVYLDTVITLGAISTTFAEPGNVHFGVGAMTASFLWFFGLALGGTRLAPLFSRPLAWKILHLAVCLTVWGVAVQLVAMLL